MSLETKKTNNPLTPQRGRLKLSPNTEGEWESIDEHGTKTPLGVSGSRSVITTDKDVTLTTNDNDSLIISSGSSVVRVEMPDDNVEFTSEFWGANGKIVLDNVSLPKRIVKSNSVAQYASKDGYSWGIGFSEFTDVWLRTYTGKNISYRAGTWSEELGLLVLVSDSTDPEPVATSPDGVVWTFHSTPSSTGLWRSIAWSAELGLFAVVAQNKVMTSPDAIVWTETAVDTAYWSSVCWSAELGLFVAVADSGTNRIMTSSDGVVWTPVVFATSDSWYSVIWSKEVGLLVAVAWSGTNKVMTSPDGINWTFRTSTISGSKVVWAKELGLFVTVADIGGEFTGRCATSPDGIVWSPRLGLSAYKLWKSVCWAPDLNKLIASTEDGFISTSSNGITWTTPVADGYPANMRHSFWATGLKSVIIITSTSPGSILHTIGY